ncbi:MAG TPA: hypothetical protein PKN33_07725 [Phycisphaerae bacterium]|nr:hypothetical protein [Phycisphaerae bacterium]
MSDVPPNILGAAAQAGFVAGIASRARDADRTGQARTAAKQIEQASDSANSVETTDGDTAVFADAEGAGGQGRAFGEGDQPAEEIEDVKPDTDPDDTQSHLDIKI